MAAMILSFQPKIKLGDRVAHILVIKYNITHSVSLHGNFRVKRLFDKTDK